MSLRAGRFLLAVLVACAVLAPGVTAQGGAPDDAPRAIQGDVHLEGDLRVERGDTLVVGPGTRFTGPGRLLVHGNLTVNGTPEEPVTFRTAVLTFQGAVVTVRHAHWEGLTTPAVTVFGGHVQARDVAFADGRVGLRVASTAPGAALRVANATLANLTHAAVDVAGPGLVRVEHAVVTGSGVGLVVTAGPGGPVDVRVASSAFHGNGADARVLVLPDATPGSTVTFMGNAFRGDGHAGSAEGPAALSVTALPGAGAGDGGDRVVVTSATNAFTEHPVAVALEGVPGEAGAFAFTSLTDAFERNGVGLRATHAGALVRGARFVDNAAWDVDAPAPADAPRVTLEDSAFSRIRLSATEVAAAIGAPAPTSPSLALPALLVGILGVAVAAAASSGTVRALAYRRAGAPALARLLPPGERDAAARERVREHVTANPGCTRERVRAATGLGTPAIAWHLHALEDVGTLARRGSGRDARWHALPEPARVTPQREEKAADAPPPTLRPAEREVLAAIVAHPGNTQSALAERLGMTRQAIHYHVKKLTRQGLVTKVPHGRETRIHAREEAEVALSATEPDA